MYTMNTHEYEDPRSELLVIYPLLMVSSVVTSLLLINRGCIRNSSINPFSHQPVEFWCGSAWWFHGKSRNWTTELLRPEVTAINHDHSKSKIDGWDSKDAKQLSSLCVFKQMSLDLPQKTHYLIHTAGSQTGQVTNFVNFLPTSMIFQQTKVH